MPSAPGAPEVPEEIVLRDASAGVYKRLILKDNKIIGTVNRAQCP